MEAMFKVFICLAFLTLYSSVVYSADSKPSVIQPLAETSLLLDITKVSDFKLIAVGERGHILSSSDGEDWHQVNVPTQATLTRVYFYDDSVGWAVGHDSTILITQDSGITWQIQQSLPKLQKPLFDIVFKNRKEGIAIGAYGQFYRTIDGGKNWTSEFKQEFLMEDDIEYLHQLQLEDEEAYIDEVASILPHFNRIFMDGRTLFLVGEMGVIAKSNNFGKSWVPYSDVYEGSFFDIVRTSRGNILVAGLRGHVYRTINNGKDWKSSNTSTHALLNSIILSDEDKIYLLGNNGTLLESFNDGITFHKIHLFDKSHLIAGVIFKEALVMVSSQGIKRTEVAK